MAQQDCIPSLDIPGLGGGGADPPLAKFVGTIFIMLQEKRNTFVAVVRGLRTLSLQ